MNCEYWRYFALNLSIFDNVYKLNHLNFWTKNDKTGYSAEWDEVYSKSDVIEHIQSNFQIHRFSIS